MYQMDMFLWNVHIKEGSIKYHPETCTFAMQCMKGRKQTETLATYDTFNAEINY